MDHYKSRYADLKFECHGLFELIQDTYACQDVLYPGCSIHITPSLYFPHIVYVDQSPEAAQFFAAGKSLIEFVNRNKVYKQSAYYRFIEQDYSTPLPLLDGSFDLLLALFAGGIASPCTRYLKIGGVLLTNNHRGDAVDAARDERLELKAQIRFKQGKYHLEAGNPGKSKIIIRKWNSKYLKQTSWGIEYEEDETYHVFERVR